MDHDSTSQVKRLGRRRFRLWEKKRGKRQTGSSWWGSAGEVGFYAGLFLASVFALSQLVAMRLTSTDTFLTSNWGLILSGFVLVALIIAGATGAIYATFLSATSTERRVALRQRAAARDLFAELDTQDFPTIPCDSHWKISPGVRLAYRLPSASTTGFRLAIGAVYTLAWNAAVIVLAVLEYNLVHYGSGEVIRAFLSRPSVNLTGVVLVLFGAFGGYLIYRLIGQLVAAEAMGPTHVELSSQPLQPGGRYRVLVTQHGHLQITQLEMWLVCDEEVSFSEGTNTRREVRRVCEEAVFHEENIRILPSEPFHYETSLDVPPDAMHSFASSHNAITWKLIVKAESKKWPNIHRVFPVVMHPHNSSAGRI